MTTDVYYNALDELTKRLEAVTSGIADITASKGLSNDEIAGTAARLAGEMTAINAALEALSNRVLELSC